MLSNLIFVLPGARCLYDVIVLSDANIALQIDYLHRDQIIIRHNLRLTNMHLKLLHPT